MDKVEDLGLEFCYETGGLGASSGLYVGCGMPCIHTYIHTYIYAYTDSVALRARVLNLFVFTL